jgi:hypothetical protein
MPWLVATKGQEASHSVCLERRQIQNETHVDSSCLYDNLGA